MYTTSADLDDEGHVGLRQCGVKEFRPDALFRLAVGGRGEASVQREGHAVENRSLAHAAPVNQEHPGAGQSREIDGALPRIWSEPLKMQCDQSHSPPCRCPRMPRTP